jgi:plastocyanin
MIGWMRKPGKPAALVLAVCIAGGAIVAATALGAAETIRAANALDFESADYATDQGETVTFDNADPGVPHNVTASGKIGGKPLFESPTVTGAASTVVNGTQYLTTGSYTFFCSVHPNMEATLNVTGAGTAVARPNISVAILSGKLAKVRGGKARVKVKAVTKSDNVALKLKLGSKQLASKSNIDLAAGQVRKLTLKLGRKARNRLAGKSKAKLKLVGSVPFGKTRTVSKLLK